MHQQVGHDLRLAFVSRTVQRRSAGACRQVDVGIAHSHEDLYYLHVSLTAGEVKGTPAIGTESVRVHLAATIMGDLTSRL